MSTVIRSGWKRTGSVWAKGRGKTTAVVAQIGGKWRYTILSSAGDVLAHGTTKSQRSRQARKAAEKALNQTPLEV